MSAIEAHLGARRGKALVLSPRDFALARAWHGSGVPLASALVGIDRAFEAAGEDVSSLAFCRRHVEELQASGLQPRARPAPPAESVPVHEVQALLATLFEKLQALRPGPLACFEPPLRKIQEVRDLMAVATRPNWDYLRAKLLEIDDDVAAALLQATSAAERESYLEEAKRATERLRGRVEDKALEGARARFVVQRARERLGLPLVSLL